MWGIEGKDVPHAVSGNVCDHSVLTGTGIGSGSPKASDLVRGSQQRADVAAEAGTAEERDAVRYGLLVTRCVT